MQTRRMLTASTSVAAIAVLAAACGGGSSGGTKQQTAKGPEYNAALTSVVQPSTKKGGDLKFVSTSDFDSLDSARTYYAFSWDFQRMWQRTLMAFNPTPGNDGTKVVPDIATGDGQVSSDGKTWTYHIKSDLKFENGTPITSKDIKYAIERVFAQDVISGGPASYYISLLDQGQNYPGPYKDKDPNHLGLKSITTPDDTTIVFHLAKPFSDFNYLMALPVTTPVPMAVDLGPNGGAKYQFHPISTGPYKIGTYQPGKLLKLVRNPNWSDDSLRKALPDTITVTMGLDALVVDNDILAQSADIDAGGAGVQQPTVQKVLTNPALKKYAMSSNTGFVRYISIQEKVPPFDNLHCRRAVQYAADKVALQFSRGGPIAGGDIATNMTSPVLASADNYNPYPSGPDNKGDVAKAKQELQACGKPNGFTTNIATTNKGKGPAQAEALQQGLARVGIKTNIIAVDPATYYSGFIGAPANVHAKDLGLAVAGWGPDYPAEYGYWESIVDGRAIKQQGNSNYAELNDPAINNDIDKALAASNRSDALAIWKDVAHKVMDDAVYLPFVKDRDVLITSNRLSNVYFDKAFGMIDYMNLGVTP